MSSKTTTNQRLILSGASQGSPSISYARPAHASGRAAKRRRCPEGPLALLYLAEAAGVEVIDGFDNLRLAVHDEGTVAHHGLVDRLAAEQQQLRIAVGLQAHFR